MSIIHIIFSIDKSSGGPARSVTLLISWLLKQPELRFSLYCLRSSSPIINNFKEKNGSLLFFDANTVGYSSQLKTDIIKQEVHLFHGHGLWQMPVHQMAKLARKSKIPYIITPRGMLEPWALDQGKLKKKLALILFQFKDLKKAACLHATAPMEVRTFRNLGLKNPIAMIPNGIALQNFSKKLPIKQKKPKSILFLSRVHPKKGIENLIKAWGQLDNDIRINWMVEIIGNGEETYIEELQQKIIRNNLHEQIVIKPPVFGLDKISTFQKASLFVLPTFSENFGIVVAEALASYTPVITTKGAPWEDLLIHNCGWWIDIGVKPLKIALEKAMQTKESDLVQMGRNGRKLIEDKYSIYTTAKQMLELYEWILNKREKPNFVSLE